MKEIGTLDRATLVVWRVTNVLGWVLFSFVGALILKVGFETGASYALSFGYDEAGATTFQQVTYLLFVGAGGSAVCGAFIGTVIGARVAAAPVITAGATALALAAAIAWAYWGSFSNSGTSFYWSIGAASCVAVPVAGMAARAVSRNRPRSLR